MISIFDVTPRERRVIAKKILNRCMRYIKNNLAYALEQKEIEPLFDCYKKVFDTRNRLSWLEESRPINTRKLNRYMGLIGHYLNMRNFYEHNKMWYDEDEEEVRFRFDEYDRAQAVYDEDYTGADFF